LVDNNSSASVITANLSHVRGTATSSGTLSTTHITTGKTPVSNLQGADITSSGGATAYFMGLQAGDTDNYSFVSITSSGATAVAIDGISAYPGTCQENCGTGAIRISEASDGVYATMLQNDNYTIAAYKIASGVATAVGTDNLSLQGGANGATSSSGYAVHCSAAHPDGGEIAVAFQHDNNSWMSAKQTSGAAWSTPVLLVDNTSAGRGRHALYGWVTDSVTGLGDNVTGSCDMAYNADGTLYFVGVTDNGTGLARFSSSDNGTTNAGWTLIDSVPDIGGAIKDVSMTIDTDLKLPVIAVNANAFVTVQGLDNSSGTNVWTEYIAKPGSANTVVGSRVSISALADGSAYAVGYESTSDNATVQIFYDE
jgi:hypothetical protein